MTVAPVVSNFARSSSRQDFIGESQTALDFPGDLARNSTAGITPANFFRGRR
jgi:hypothetical protein